MRMASSHDLFVSMEHLDERMRAFEKRFVRLLVLTQIIGVSLLAALILFRT